MKRLALLGSTGSIGQQTLEVVRWHPDEFSVAALVAQRPSQAFDQQVAEFAPRDAWLTARDGVDGLVDLVRGGDVDVVVVATSGTVGFAPTLAAPHADLARCYEVQQRHDQALLEYRRAIECAPDEAPHYLGAGLTLKHLKDYPEATEMFRAVVRLHPGHAEAYRQLAAVGALGFLDRHQRRQARD